MDDYLKEYCLKNRIKLEGLEPHRKTFDYLNRNLYSNTTEEKLIEILKSKIKLLNSENQNINCLILNEYRTKSTFLTLRKKFKKKFITLRNKDWIVKIDNAIQENEKAFIFVGLYHLDFKEGY